jgi:hypothetical protein
MSVTAVKLWAFCGHDDRPIVGGALILTLSSGLLRKGSTTKARSSATTVIPQAISARTVVGGNVTVVGGSTTSDVGFMLDGDNVTVDGGGARIVTVTGGAAVVLRGNTARSTPPRQGRGSRPLTLLSQQPSEFVSATCWVFVVRVVRRTRRRLGIVEAAGRWRSGLPMLGFP